MKKSYTSPMATIIELNINYSILSASSEGIKVDREDTATGGQFSQDKGPWDNQSGSFGGNLWSDMEE